MKAQLLWLCSLLAILLAVHSDAWGLIALWDMALWLAVASWMRFLPAGALFGMMQFLGTICLGLALTSLDFGPPNIQGLFWMMGLSAKLGWGPFQKIWVDALSQSPAWSLVWFQFFPLGMALLLLSSAPGALEHVVEFMPYLGFLMGIQAWVLLQRSRVVMEQLAILGGLYGMWLGSIMVSLGPSEVLLPFGLFMVSHVCLWSCLRGFLSPNTLMLHDLSGEMARQHLGWAWIGGLWHLLGLPPGLGFWMRVHLFQRLQAPVIFLLWLLLFAVMAFGYSGLMQARIQRAPYAGSQKVLPRSRWSYFFGIVFLVLSLAPMNIYS